MEKIRNFQCTVCLVYFDDQLSHKSHYKTQWHTFNLMRKQIDKSPIRLDQYDELIKLQNDSSETKEKIPCIICNKRFENIKSFNNHVKSKKHLSLGKIFKARKVDVDSNSVSLKKDDVETGKTCLFCTLNFSSNDYMSHLKKHSFIPPNSDQLIDRDGLITLLHELVHVAFQCIYCCKLFSNSEAVKNHMDNTGHKNIPFDTIEECEDSVFYQFYHKSGTEIVIYGEEYEDEVLDDGTDEYKMVLPSGYTLGHRKFKVYYNQKACLATVGSDGCKKMVNKSSWITKNKQAMHHQKQEYQHISKRNLHISKQTNNQKHFFDPNSLCQ